MERERDIDVGGKHLSVASCMRLTSDPAHDPGVALTRNHRQPLAHRALLQPAELISLCR